MSGKLILKRKRESHQRKSVVNETDRSEGNESRNFSTIAATITDSASRQEDDYAESQPANKRDCRSVTPPLTPPTSSDPPAPAPIPPIAQPKGGTTTVRNGILLEALQKIMELQQELDDFESDLDESGVYPPMRSDAEDERQHREQQQQQQPLRLEQQQRNEAEALGYAMCAREALQFLQREVSTDSLIYRTLRERLLERSDPVIPL